MRLGLDPHAPDKRTYYCKSLWQGCPGDTTDCARVREPSVHATDLGLSDKSDRSARVTQQ